MYDNEFEDFKYHQSQLLKSAVREIKKEQLSELRILLKRMIDNDDHGMVGCDYFPQKISLKLNSFFDLISYEELKIFGDKFVERLHDHNKNLFKNGCLNNKKEISKTFYLLMNSLVRLIEQVESTLD